jgi:hypothetical protein
VWRCLCPGTDCLVLRAGVAGRAALIAPTDLGLLSYGRFFVCEDIPGAQLLTVAPFPPILDNNARKALISSCSPCGPSDKLDQGATPFKERIPP